MKGKLKYKQELKVSNAYILSYAIFIEFLDQFSLSLQIYTAI